MDVAKLIPFTILIHAIRGIVCSFLILLSGVFFITPGVVDYSKSRRGLNNTNKRDPIKPKVANQPKSFNTFEFVRVKA